jgi:hypothetical protein
MLLVFGAGVTAALGAILLLRHSTIDGSAFGAVLNSRLSPGISLNSKCGGVHVGHGAGFGSMPSAIKSNPTATKRAARAFISAGEYPVLIAPVRRRDHRSAVAGRLTT